MRINGIKLETMRIVELYLPIAGGGAVEFRFRPLGPDEDFENIVKPPVAPQVSTPNNGWKVDTKDKGYQSLLSAWAAKKINWEFLKSISATTGLEWETVTDDPETWKNWRDDLGKFFSSREIDLIFDKFLEAQYIDEKVLKKAREAFLSSILARESPEFSRMGEAASTPSSEPVNVSV